MSEQIVPVGSQVPLIRLSDVDGLEVFGHEGNRFALTEPDKAFTGNIRVVGLVHEGIQVDGDFFGIGRNSSFYLTGDVGGRVELRVPYGITPALRRRGQVMVEIQDGTIAENFILLDDATGHGSLKVRVTGRIDSSVVIETSGETGISSLVEVIITGCDAESVVVKGLPSRVTAKAGVLHIEISSNFDPAVAKRLAEEEAGHQELRYGSVPVTK